MAAGVRIRVMPKGRAILIERYLASMGGRRERHSSITRADDAAYENRKCRAGGQKLPRQFDHSLSILASGYPGRQWRVLNERGRHFFATNSIPHLGHLPGASV